MSTITLTGNRQSGKTHTLLGIGADHAAHRGFRVGYVGAKRQETTEAFRQYLQMTEKIATPAKVYQGCGEEKVKYTPSGVIYFACASHRAGWSIAEIDVLLLDEVEQPDELQLYPQLRIFQSSRKTKGKIHHG